MDDAEIRFRWKLKDEKDTEYLKSLLQFARGISQSWIIMAIEQEIASREQT